MPSPTDTAATAAVPVFSLTVFHRDGTPAITLQKGVDGVMRLEGDPAYLEDLVHAINTVRFFRHDREPGSAAPHN